MRHRKIDLNWFLGIIKSRPAKASISILLIFVAIWMSGINSIWQKLLEFPILPLAFVSLLLLLNLWLVGIRYWRILNHFSCVVPFRMAAFASLRGHFAGLMVSSLPGQAIGRQSVMDKFGISPALNSVLLAYERFLILCISGALSVVAASYLFGAEAASKFRRFKFEEQR